MNVKNLAQGDFVIAGGYVSWYLVQNGFPALLGVPVAFVVMWGIGWVVYKLVISRVIERDLFTSLLATFGLAIMMAQILNLLFGSDTQSVDLDYDVLYFFDGFIDVPIAKLIGVLMASALAAGVIIFMKSSRMGQAIRATAQDARAARVMGIDTEKVYAFTFSLNSAICGAGIAYSIRAFVIVTAAGLGNLPGVIAAGLGIGALEQYGAHIFGIGYQQAIAVLLLLLVLLIRLIQQRRNRQVLK
jgi:branched-chain amino acid transport system permease protein